MESKTLIDRAFLAAALVLVTAAAQADHHGKAKTLLDQVTKACETELQNFCSSVTPGEGRLVHCMIAHEDKISAQCQTAIFEAADVIEKRVRAMAEIGLMCEDDLVEHCIDVKVGEGRVLQCLADKGDLVSASCRETLNKNRKTLM